MAGGTGGHIFPGLALAEKLIANGWQVQWIGTADRMEADIVPKHNILIHFIEVKGLRGNGIKRLLFAPLMLLKAFFQARRILTNCKPSVVIGFGGYASGPGGLAAKSMGLPLIIHEQNAVLGLTNRYLAKLATKTLLAFPLIDAEQSVYEVVGNPVRADIAKLHEQPKRVITPDSKINILVIGGSLGARVLNKTLPSILSKLATDCKLAVQHQVGKGNKAEVTQQYQAEIKALKVSDLEISVDEFIDDMPKALYQADIVVCRAGALTVSELAASGNVGIFVPLPHAVDDHQTANANWLVKQDAGILVPQRDIEIKMVEVLANLFTDRTRINKMQCQSAKQAVLTTTERMLELCNELELSN